MAAARISGPMSHVYGDPAAGAALRPPRVLSPQGHVRAALSEQRYEATIGFSIGKQDAISACVARILASQVERQQRPSRHTPARARPLARQTSSKSLQSLSC